MVKNEHTYKTHNSNLNNVGHLDQEKEVKYSVIARQRC